MHAPSGRLGLFQPTPRADECGHRVPTSNHAPPNSEERKATDEAVEGCQGPDSTHVHFNAIGVSPRIEIFTRAPDP